jgi:hypothetical protein
MTKYIILSIQNPQNQLQRNNLAFQRIGVQVRKGSVFGREFAQVVEN